MDARGGGVPGSRGASGRWPGPGPGATPGSGASGRWAGTPGPGGPAGGAGGAADPARVAARDALARALAADPACAPHGELVFALDRELERGPGVVVHQATDRRLGRAVALARCLDPDPARRARFLAEAGLRARLDHPGVPAVYLAGTSTTGEPFVAGRQVRGLTLGEALQRGIAREALLDAVVAAVETLAAAHARGVTHGALGPEAVVLAGQGEVLVTAWARAVEGTDPAARQADVRALGALLEAVVAGPAAALALGRRARALAAVATAASGRRTKGAEGAEGGEGAGGPGGSGGPAPLYRDAGALARDLRAARDGAPVAAAPEGPLARLARAAGRRPGVAAALGAALFLAVGAAPLVRQVRADAGQAARGRLAAAARAAWTALPVPRAPAARAGAGGADLRAAADGQPADPRAGGVEAALARLGAAERWFGLAPDDPAARAARLEAALGLAAGARAAGQWALGEAALRAVEDLGAAGAPAAEAAAAALARARADLAAARAEEGTRRRTRAAALLEEAASGALEARPDGLRQAVLELVRLADAETLGLLVARLDEVSARLEAEAAAAWAEAARPAPGDALHGFERLDGLLEALARLDRARPGDPEHLLADPLVTEAARRLGARARPPAPARVAPVDARPAAFALVGARQREALGPGPLRLAALCCEALGRLASTAPAARREVERALLRHLAAEADGPRALAPARALLRVGDLEALQAVRRAVARFGSGRPFDLQVGPPLARRLHALEGASGADAREDDPAAGAQPEPARLGVDEAFERASLLLDRGAWAEAERLFDAIVAADPTNVGALGNRALARIELGRLDEALADLTAALTRLPDHAPILVNRATLLTRLGRDDEAEADLLRARALAPGLPHVHNGLGLLLAKRGAHADALAAYGEALALDPTLRDALLNRARLRLDLGEFAEAEADMAAVLRLDPGAASVHAQVASLHLTRGDVGAMRLAARRALDLDPDEPTALGCWGVALMHEGRPAEARDVLGRALARAAPGAAHALRVNRAHCALQLGDAPAALEDLRAAVTLAPAGVQAWWMLAMAALDCQRLDEALAAADRAVALGPRDPPSLSTRGQVRLARGELAPARADLERARALEPGSAGHALHLGFVTLLEGDEAGARALFAEAEAGQPYATVWLATLGAPTARLEALAGRLDVLGHLARHHLGRVAAADLPGLAEAAPERDRAWARCEVQAHLGLLALARGEREAGLAHLRRAVAAGRPTSNAHLVAAARLARLEGGR